MNNKNDIIIGQEFKLKINGSFPVGYIMKTGDGSTPFIVTSKVEMKWYKKLLKIITFGIYSPHYEYTLKLLDNQ